MTPLAKIRLPFLAGIVLFFMTGISAYMAISRLVSAQQWVAHSRDVQVSLSQLNTLITRAGRTRSEFVDSGDADKLREHRQILDQIPLSFASLRQLLTDNAPQRDRLDQLSALTSQRIDLLRDSIALRQAGRSTVANQAEISLRIVGVAGQMDSLIQTMQDQEQTLLELRLNRGRAGARLSAILLVGTFLLACGLVVLTYRRLAAELERREQAEASLHKLSARILRIQDEERRKFARDLHDSLGQYLVAAKMNIDSLAAKIPNQPTLADSSQLLDHALGETRTISHLLHPPTLDETGFASAARWYLEGFSKRSGITTTIDLPPNLGRLDPSVELALFRVLQESLTNIHRHSQGTQAEVALALTPQTVTLRVRDNGKGIARDTLRRFRKDGLSSGVGLAGMRERLRELGGHLAIDSSSAGTQLTATLPSHIEISRTSSR